MIYKVYYQENTHQIPVRENTKSMYVEADSERTVREKLKIRGFNIEFIQALEGEHLSYEQADPHFEIEKV